MRLEGIHHITLITGDAPRNVDFYTRVLGLRLVKKTVNQDDPTVYHLFYADEQGSAGADITFFEYPGARRGRAGAGMIHTIVWRVACAEALDFWAERLGAEGDRGRAARRQRSRSPTPRGCSSSSPSSRPTTRRSSRSIRRSPRSSRSRASTACARTRPTRSAAASCSRQTLGFAPGGDATWEARGEQRGGWFAYDAPPEGAGVPGAGTVHHVAWASHAWTEQEAWQQRVADAGCRPTPVIDRFYFRSIYFREPSGVLFEIATLGPGFATDEDPEHLGERLSLPPAFEHLREQIEPVLTPLPDPRASWSTR